MPGFLKQPESSQVHLALEFVHQTSDSFQLCDLEGADKLRDVEELA